MNYRKRTKRIVVVREQLKNDGLYWNGKDLRDLWKAFRAGKTIMEISEQLQRSPTACQNRLRMLKVVALWQYGSDTDTLLTYRAQPGQGY